MVVISRILKTFSMTWKKILLLIIVVVLIIKNMIITDIDDWDNATSLDLKVYIKPEENTKIIQPNLLKIGNENITILAIVSSHPKNFAHREAIRLTWGNEFNNMHSNNPEFDGQIIFQVGLEKPNTPGIKELLKEESEQYGDLLVQDFVEHYNNLTIKTVMLLKYVSQLTVIPTFIFKTDDDVFLNVKNLMHAFPKKEHYNQITGHLVPNDSPIRWAYIWEEGKKWICPHWMHSNDTYPPFVAGSGYIIPGKFIPCLYETALNTNHVIYEDVFVTGIVAQNCGFKKGNLPGFIRYFVNPCHQVDPLILIHHTSPNGQFYLFNSYLNLCHLLPTSGHYNYLFKDQKEKFLQRRSYSPLCQNRFQFFNWIPAPFC